MINIYSLRCHELINDEWVEPNSFIIVSCSNLSLSNSDIVWWKTCVRLSIELWTCFSNFLISSSFFFVILSSRKVISDTNFLSITENFSWMLFSFLSNLDLRISIDLQIFRTSSWISDFANSVKDDISEHLWSSSENLSWMWFSFLSNVDWRISVECFIFWTSAWIFSISFLAMDETSEHFWSIRYSATNNWEHKNCYKLNWQCLLQPKLHISSTSVHVLDTNFLSLLNSKTDN